MSNGNTDVNEVSCKAENLDNSKLAIQPVAVYLKNEDLPQICQEKEPHNRKLQDFCCCWQSDGITCCYVSSAVVGIVGFLSSLWILFYNMQKAIEDSNAFIEDLPCNSVHTVMKVLMILSGIQAAFAFFAVGVVGYYVMRRAHDKRVNRLVAIAEGLIFVSYLIVAFWEVIEFYQVQDSSSCIQSVKSQSHYWTMFCFQNAVAIFIWSLIGLLLSYILISFFVNHCCPIAGYMKARKQKGWSKEALCDYKIDFVEALKDMKEIQKSEDEKMESEQHLPSTGDEEPHN